MRDQFLYKEKCQSLTYFTELKTRSCTFTTIARTSVTQLSALVDFSCQGHQWGKLLSPQSVPMNSNNTQGPVCPDLWMALGLPPLFPPGHAQIRLQALKKQKPIKIINATC